MIPIYIPDGFPDYLAPPDIDRKRHPKEKESDIPIWRQQYKDFYKDEPAGRLHHEIMRRIGHNTGMNLVKHNIIDKYTEQESAAISLPHFKFALSILLRDLKKEGYLAVPVIEKTGIELFSRTGFETISMSSSRVIEIKTDNLEWDQIKDFRKDKKSRKALRNYRLFWIDNYNDKSVSYIEDDLERKYERFVFSCKKHGFDIIHDSIDHLFQSKSILAASTIAFASAILGEPFIFSTSIAAGVSLEIGRMSLNIARAKIKHKEIIENSDLLYLYKLSNEFD